MLSKKDLIKRLREHPLYKAALASVDDDQAKKIASMTEGFLGQAAEGLVPMMSQMNDAQTMSSLKEVLKEDGRVLIVDPEISGSRNS